MVRFKVLVFIMGAIICGNSSAALISQGNYATDNTTGLNWLNFSETLGESYNTVTNNMGSSQKYDGWRYATYEEVMSLWESYVPGLVDGQWHLDNEGITSSIGEILGYTYTAYTADYESRGILAMYQRESTTGDSTIYGKLDDIVSGVGYDLIKESVVSRIYNDVENEDPRIASYLVSNVVSVPEPNILSLFIAPLVFFMFSSLKRRNL